MNLGRSPFVSGTTPYIHPTSTSYRSRDGGLLDGPSRAEVIYHESYVIGYPEDEIGYRVEWQELPIGRIYRYLREGQIDLWAGSSRVPYVADFTVEPDFQPMEIRLCAFHLPETPSVDSVADLRASQLILIRGYTYLGVLDEAIEDRRTPYDLAPSHTSGMRMLREGRGDYLLDFKSPATTALEEVDVPDIQRSHITQWPIAHVFSHHTDDLETIIERMEAAWERIDR